MDSLTPEFFDFLVIVNIVIGVIIAGRRFLKDIRGPLPDDAPDWARAADYTRATRHSSSDNS